MSAEDRKKAEPFAVVRDGMLVAADDTVVPWWSFGKTVIAAAALALVQQRRLALDAPLASRRFTLRQLLQHRAGLTDYGALAAYHAAVAAGDEPWPVAMLMERTEAERLRYEPGQSWGYSNIGYMLVTDLIERTCGQELGDALTDLVLRPLGIAGVRLARVPADLHDVRMGDVRMGGVASYHPGWVYHGLLVGPLGEAALLLDRLMRGATLEPELLAQMGEPHWLDPARATSTEQRPWRTPGYGLGVMCGVATNGRRVIGHTGGGPGSVIAVFCMGDSESPITSAAFALGNEPAGVECRVTELENAPNPRWGVSQEGPTATNR